LLELRKTAKMRAGALVTLPDAQYDAWLNTGKDEYREFLREYPA
jgi:hypothetical protein